MLIRAAVAGAAAASPRRLLLSTLLYHIPRSPTTTTTAIPLHLHRTSSSSSTRWKSRQSSDPYTRASKLAGLKSRAAYKLLEIHDRHRLFRSGATVVDLGYAPGSWSQVALSKVQPGGRVIGIDVIPAQPPRGVSTLQGDFLSEGIREEVRRFVRGEMPGGEVGDGDAGTVAETISMEKDRDRIEGRVVDVVLSDMSDPWPLDHNAWIKSVNRPFLRMMNTSGIAFKDHAGSMDLCTAALEFSYDTLVTGGSFLCKFYQGAEDHAFELRLKKLFEKVHRIKPESSRKESKEAYLVGLRRKAGVERGVVLGDAG